ncbi:MAG: type II secretion system protein GspL, partial [Gammaproteobacteria bacterium]
KAIPFALEDQIIDDVESMHFALGLGDAQGRYWIAAVARTQMDEWQDVLRQAGLNPQALIPDIMLLDSAEGEARLLCEAQRSLLTLPDAQRLVVDNENLALILKRLMLNTELNIERLECYTSDPALDLEALVAAHVNADVNAHLRPALLVFAESLATQAPLNLLQGDYSRRERRRHRFQVWYPAAAMLAVWIVAQLVVAGVDNILLASQLDEIRAQQQQVYAQAFPNARPGGDVYRKMEAGLKELRQRHGTADASFYYMLSKIAPTLAASSGAQVQSLRYREGSVELDLQLPTLQALDQLKASLDAQLQWQVEIQSASSAGERVEARLQIRSRT